MTQSPSASDLRQWGFEALEQIRRDYYLPEQKLYAEEISKEGVKAHPTYNWGVGVMLSALNAAARQDPKYKPWLIEFADASRSYWNPAGPVPGYDVLPGPKPIDRYYDDNAWMVMALVETYEITRDPKYLTWAEETMTYVLSGMDDKLGGGIYWRESDKQSKNTCSNAPSASALLSVMKAQRKYDRFVPVRQILNWQRRVLRDPQDGLYWDSINLSEKIDKTKWSYNTGLSIRAFKEMSKSLAAIGLGNEDPALQPTADLMMQEARRFAAEHRDTRKAAIQHWFTKDGAINCETKFAHLLLENLYETPLKEQLSPGGPIEDDLKKKALKALHVLRQNRGTNGKYGGRWNQPLDPNKTKFPLIDQASAVRAFLVGAENLR